MQWVPALQRFGGKLCPATKLFLATFATHLKPTGQTAVLKPPAFVYRWPLGHSDAVSEAATFMSEGVKRRVPRAWRWDLRKLSELHRALALGLRRRDARGRPGASGHANLSKCSSKGQRCSKLRDSKHSRQFNAFQAVQEQKAFCAPSNGRQISEDLRAEGWPDKQNAGLRRDCMAMHGLISARKCLVQPPQKVAPPASTGANASAQSEVPEVAPQGTQGQGRPDLLSQPSSALIPWSCWSQRFQIH